MADPITEELIPIGDFSIEDLRMLHPNEVASLKAQQAEAEQAAAEEAAATAAAAGKGIAANLSTNPPKKSPTGPACESIPLILP